MRKSYIGWWVASAFCFMCLYNSYGYGYGSGDDFTIGLFFLLGCLFLYLGYRRHKEYKEYQEDRRIRNELYQKLKDDPRITQSEPAVSQTRSAEPGMTVMTADMKRREEERAARQQRLDDARREREERERATAEKREGTVMREFSVAGVSMRQDIFKKAGYRNEEYSLSKTRIIDEGLEDENIPQYLFDTVYVSLELDPENEHDPNAVKVLLNDEHIGYIPADDSEYVHDMMEDDRIADIDAKIVGGPYKRYNSDLDEIEKEDLYFGMRLYLYVKQGR